MSFRSSPFFLLTFCSIVATTIAAAPQEKHAPAPAETLAKVPALEAFHEVVFPMWHDAWPNKNIAKLVGMLPDVKRGVAGIANAELPGILREKKAVWIQGVKELQLAAGAYEAAAIAADSQGLLNATERLHMRYEGLVRVIRPVLREIDDFHASLYALYHYFLPHYSLEKIGASATELKAKMGPLGKASLPERWKAKSATFARSRADLGTAVDALEAAVAGKNEARVKAAVEEVHARYEAMTAVFE